MPEMFGYIFSTLEATERAVRNQARINRNIAMFALAISAYAVYQAKKVSALHQKVKELEEKSEM